MTTIIAGLGNPGAEYEKTFHNMGFLSVDLLAEKLGKKIKKAECSALTWTGSIGGEKTVLAKPVTYMNLSGDAVKSLVAKYGGEVIVIYDDIDIPLGSLRARAGGTAGTHNGMKSVVERLGRTDLKRIRIGIGRGAGDLKDYVLSRPTETEAKLLSEARERLADSLLSYLKDHRDFERLMRELNAPAN